MRSLEESIIRSLDGTDKELYPFLPYILQDIWEIGTDPGTIISLIRKHFPEPQSLKVLDLACGKGAVSVKLAQALRCTCYGIDGIREFINEANMKAQEYEVDSLCTFETGDIRDRIKDLTGFDVVILGSIGTVLGDHYETLSMISGCIKQDGVVILDDGYLDDSNPNSHPVILKKSIVLDNIKKSGMELIDETVLDREYIRKSDEYIFWNIKKRCRELIEKHPDMMNIFENYINNQEQENCTLEKEIICSTMVIKNSRLQENK
ncbi:MAG: methyltransferase domain-containing protein [Elusimicrobia bacterium]|nr:methyltransferase domain-containing protein [Elusimicrobiota bacterium]